MQSKRNVWNRTSSFWHFTSASSLDRQETESFLLLPLFFGSCKADLRMFSSWRLHLRNCPWLTFPCFHSSWYGQQHEASNGMVDCTEAPKALKTILFTLFDTIYKRFYNSFLQFRASRPIWRDETTGITTKLKWRPCCEIRDTIASSS